jgi:hypothetical protein
LEFWDLVQRRGARVFSPEIGSRDGVFCLGEFLGFYAELRRDFEWGNLRWGFFEVLLVGPRGPDEEGGQWCVAFVHFGGI